MTDLLANDQVATTLARALGSQYQIVRLLGRGGMGAVYMAHEPFLERDVAVKVLPSEFGTGTARERFLREARTAARLSHPNIVPLYTFGQAEDVLYYVMGYVEGESLEARLQREGWRRTRCDGSRASWPRRWSTRTRRAWSIATSSRTTCCWSAPRDGRC
jgi:serine/threonine protein kinase